jgi:hypothetical protein
MPRRFVLLSAAFLVGLLALPACKKKGGDPTDQSGPGSDRESLRESAANLKQIGLAMHNYLGAHNGFPRGIYGPSGKIGLSWRVALLPYVEQDVLYKQFKLNEPWDSPHNKALAARMPAIYAAPGKENSDGLTHYRSFEGKDGLLRPVPPGAPGQHARGLGVTQISDGFSNTAVVVEATEPTVWTKPDDLPFESNTVPKLGIFRSGTNILLGDGSIYVLKEELPPATLKALLTPAGGEVVMLP